MLLLTFGLVTVGLLALFWGGGLIAQGYLYNQPADRFPIRAAVAALLVGGFITVWVSVDRGAPGKYDTFFEFAGEKATEFHEFDAVRWQAVSGGGGKIAFKTDDKGGGRAELVSHVKKSGGKSGRFVDDRSGKEFMLNGSMPDGTQVFTRAIVVKGEDGTPVRLEAELKVDDRTGATYTGGRPKFSEPKGSRYVWGDQPGRMIVPSTGTVVAALAINALLFVVWFVACWPVMRFGWAHALGFAAVFGLVTMLVLMPLLFKPNRTPREPAAAAPPLLLRPADPLLQQLALERVAAGRHDPFAASSPPTTSTFGPIRTPSVTFSYGGSTPPGAPGCSRFPAA